VRPPLVSSLFPYTTLFRSMRDFQRMGGNRRNLMVGKINNPLGMPGQWRGIAGDEMLAMSDANHQWASQPRSNHHLGIVPKQKHRSEEHTSELQSRENLVCR